MFHWIRVKVISVTDQGNKLNIGVLAFFKLIFFSDVLISLGLRYVLELRGPAALTQRNIADLGSTGIPLSSSLISGLSER